MADEGTNKHQRNSAKTRDRLIDAAVRLYGDRSIDAVSLREIGNAAGQKNPNATQYHFRDRDGLLQAIIDKHSAEVATYRKDYYARSRAGEWPAAESAARCLVMPIIDYVEANREAVNFVKVVSQITALNQVGPDRQRSIGIVFPTIPELRDLLDVALAHLPRREAEQRIFLGVNTAFHSIADIYKASAGAVPNDSFSARQPYVEQLICLLVSFFGAASTEETL